MDDRGELNVWFPGLFPEELKGETEALIRRWVPVICPNIYTVVVVMAELDGPEAMVDVRSEYRAITITLTALYASLDPRKRERTICHELVHAIAGPLDDFVECIVGKLPEEVRAYLEPVYTKTMEGLVQDTALALLRARAMGRAEAA